MTLELRVDVATRRIEGTNTLRVVGRVAGSDVLTLDALEFVYCRVEAEGVEAEYDGQRLRVRWSTPLAVGEEREVRVAYAVEAPRAGLYGSPHAAADPHASPFVITDAETERARHWMPCVDHPSVRTTLDWSLRSGAEWTALANGDYLGEEQHDDGTKTTRWRLAQRCPAYLACFCVGPFFRVDDATFVGRKGEVPIAYFALPRFEADDLRRAFGRTGDMLAWIEERLDLAFPYTKYFQVAAPGIGGAMENISLVTWDDRALLNEDLALEWTQQLDQINVHEMAHAYFGDAVVCRDFAHAWLKESWAVFIELAWLEHDRGKEDALYDELMCREAYFAECEQRYVRPIITRTFASSWELFDQHLYPGGAVRLAALRAQLGEDTFWRATQTYLQRFEGRVVETSDLIRVFEEVSGRSLHAWFDQWFKQPGYPRLEVTYTPDPAADQATLEVRQTQVDDDAGVGLFRFSLEVDVTWGEETTTHTLQVEGASRDRARLPHAADEQDPVRPPRRPTPQGSARAPFRGASARAAPPAPRRRRLRPRPRRPRALPHHAPRQHPGHRGGLARRTPLGRARADREGARPGEHRRGRRGARPRGERRSRRPRPLPDVHGRRVGARPEGHRGARRAPRESRSRPPPPVAATARRARRARVAGEAAQERAHRAAHSARVRGRFRRLGAGRRAARARGVAPRRRGRARARRRRARTARAGRAPVGATARSPSA